MSGNVIFDPSEQDSKDVADTSKEAYKHLIESGKLEGQKESVLKAVNAMKVVPTIDELVHEALADWQKSTVSGRINDLKNLGLVECAGKRESQYSGVKSKVWVLTSKGKNVLEEMEK